MVVLAFIGDAETDHYPVQKFRFRQWFPDSREIIPRMKDQLVFAGTEFIFRQQGLIATPILVGRRAAELVAAIVNTVQVDPHSSGGTPVGGIQYMRSKKSH